MQHFDMITIDIQDKLLILTYLLDPRRYYFNFQKQYLSKMLVSLIVIYVVAVSKSINLSIYIIGHQISPNHHKWQAQVSSGFEALLGLASSELDRTKEVKRQSLEASKGDHHRDWAHMNGAPHTVAPSHKSPSLSRSKQGSITSGVPVSISEMSRSPRAKSHHQQVSSSSEHTVKHSRSRTSSGGANNTDRSRGHSPTQQQSDEESNQYKQYDKLFKKRFHKDWKKQNSPKPVSTSASSGTVTTPADTLAHEETRYGKFRHWERKGTSSPATAPQGNQENHRSTISRSSDNSTPTSGRISTPSSQTQAGGRSSHVGSCSPPSRPGSAFHYSAMPTLHQQNSSLPPPTLSPHTPYASSIGSLPPTGTPTPPILTAQDSRPSSAGSRAHTPVGLPLAHTIAAQQNLYRQAPHLISEGLIPYQPSVSPLSMPTMKGVMNAPHVLFADMNHAGAAGYPYRAAMLEEMGRMQSGAISTELLALNSRPGFPGEPLPGIYNSHPPGPRGTKESWKNYTSPTPGSDTRIQSRP